VRFAQGRVPMVLLEAFAHPGARRAHSVGERFEMLAARQTGSASCRSDRARGSSRSGHADCGRRHARKPDRSGCSLRPLQEAIAPDVAGQRQADDFGKFGVGQFREACKSTLMLVWSLVRERYFVGPCTLHYKACAKFSIRNFFEHQFFGMRQK